MSDDADYMFDWTSEEDIAIPETPQTAVYLNRFGSVVVRQRRDVCDDGDPYIYFQPAHLVALVRAMIRVAELPLKLVPLDAETERPARSSNKSAKDGTGAERQKRYRQRRRNGVTRDTESDVTRDAPDRDGDLLDAAE